MANRRFGGPPQRGVVGGNRGFSQNANVNPWQGSGNNAPGMNALGGNPNLQTQIALALTSLLQPQQANDPPSLLSLNTSPGNFNQDFSNRGGQRGRDFRRNEPYKNPRNVGGGGGGWRIERGANPNSRGNAGAPRNRPFNKDKVQHGNSPRDKLRPNRKSSDNKPPADADVSQRSDIKDEKRADNVDENRDEESSDTKRDWKEEKNTNEEKPEGEGSAKKDGKYAGLPNSLFHCFVCNKSMWDGDSYQNHIRGKAHIQMLDSLEESFQITVKILRENMRLAEEKKLIEWRRMQRNNRKFHQKNEPESHCNMCDGKFMGNIISHRKTAGHQRLKRFLHPNCDTCNLEFPSRMEWVEHRFTPEHLFKLKEILETKTGDDSEGFVVEEDVEWDNDPILQESLQCEDENVVLELDDDLSNLYNRVPTYQTSRPVGRKSLTPMSGFFCSICKTFLKTKEDSEKHLKSEKHYHEFVSVAKELFRAKVEREEKEGNWKRKRAEKEAAEAVETTKEDVDDTKVKKENGDDMYDPEEACKDCDESLGGSDDPMNAETKTEENMSEGDSLNNSQKVEDAETEVVEIKEEAAAEEEATPQGPNTRRRPGAVKNNAGPKSKKIRKA